MTRLVALALWCGVGAAQTLTDDFNGGLAETAWEPAAVGWRVTDGALTGELGHVLWRAAPYADQLTFACDVTVLEILKGDWRTAGIGFLADDANYWALQFVVAPEADGRRQFTELQEMLRGTWLAQTQEGSRLPSLTGRGATDWRLNHPYRLEIRLLADRLEGTIADGATLVAEYAYRFPEGVPAVRAGRPLLRANGLRARFDNATVTIARTAPEPQATVNRPTWVSRPGESLVKGTGFFATAEVDGRWWLVDPEGKPFFALGTDHIRYTGHWCEQLGYAPYHRQVQQKYGSEEKWGETTLARLRAWGYNNLAGGHSASLRHHGLPHTLWAGFGSGFARRSWICEPIHWTGFPDVFSPDWPVHCRLVARKLAAEGRDDPWVLGTFLDNELEWYGKRGHLVDEIFQRPADQPGKLALADWLERRFGGWEQIDRALGVRYGGRAGFLAATTVPAPSEALTAIRDGFLAEIAERYFAVAVGALREFLPRHLNLGSRFAGRLPDPVLAAAGRWCDVFTINTYPRVDFLSAWGPGLGGTVHGVPRQLTSIYATVRKPFIITEWSFPALDSGLPCKHGAGMRVDTQAQKAACFRIFANAVTDLPFIVGFNYFMWNDEPALGISSGFPEDSNYGLVNEQDEPYTELVETATEINHQAAARHARAIASGELELVRVGPGFEVRNPATIASRGWLRLTGAGEERIEELLLPAGGSRALAAPVGAWTAELQLWDGTKQRLLGGAGLGPRQVANGSATTLQRLPVVLDTDPPTAALIPTLGPGQTYDVPAATAGWLATQTIELKAEGATWACRRVDGALFDTIDAGGLRLGQLQFATHQIIDGQHQWVTANVVDDLQVSELRDAWVLRLTVSRTPDGRVITAVDEAGQQARPATGPALFRARAQVVVFKGEGLCLVRPLAVESLDPRPWVLEDLFVFCRSAIGGDAADDEVGGPGVPNYYLPAVFWTDTKLGGSFGVATPPGAWQASFWKDPGGGFHPDARFPVQRTLNRGERWAEPIPDLWVYAAREADVWRSYAARALQSAELRRP